VLYSLPTFVDKESELEISLLLFRSWRWSRVTWLYLDDENIDSANMRWVRRKVTYNDLSQFSVNFHWIFHFFLLPARTWMASIRIRRCNCQWYHTSIHSVHLLLDSSRRFTEFFHFPACRSRFVFDVAATGRIEWADACAYIKLWLNVANLSQLRYSRISASAGHFARRWSNRSISLTTPARPPAAFFISQIHTAAAASAASPFSSTPRDLSLTRSLRSSPSK